MADEVLIGDLMFYLGIPLAIRGLAQFKRVARILLLVAGFFPLAMLYPPGAKDEPLQPKYTRYWKEADLLAGDLHYIRKYCPADLSGKIVLTNTTTPENIEMLRNRDVRQVITSTQRYDGRSCGVNMMETILTAYAGLGHPLLEPELEVLIDELDLWSSVLALYAAG